MTAPDETARRISAYSNAWRRSNPTSRFGSPPQTLFGFVSRLVSPDDLLGQYWIDGGSEQRGYSSGRAVLITASLIYDVQYADVPNDFIANRSGAALGTSTVRTFQRSDITEVGRRVAQVVGLPGYVAANEITVKAERDWSISLPGETIYDGGEDYFAEALRVFGLSNA